MNAGGSVDTGNHTGSGGSSTGAPSSRCRCKIDLTTAESLQRDFYAWLNGAAIPSTSTAPVTCTFAITSNGSSPSEIPTASRSGIIKLETLSPQPGQAPINGIKLEVMEDELERAAIGVTGSNEQLPTLADCIKRTTSTAGMATTTLHHVKGQGRNVYGRPYCPGRPLSESERSAIVDLHLQGMKVNAISKRLRISHGCVSKTIARFKGGPPDHPQQRSKPPSAMVSCSSSPLTAIAKKSHKKS